MRGGWSGLSTHRVGGLEGEPVAGFLADGCEQVVEGEELFPGTSAACLSQPRHNEVLQVGNALVLPDLVGDAHQKVLDLDFRAGPRRVSDGEASQFRADAAGEQQLPSGFFMFGTGA